MSHIFQNYPGDITIIGILALEVVILTILSINTLKKTRSLSNIYFSIVFFLTVFLSVVNIAIRALSIVIGEFGASSAIILTYLILVSIVTTSMVVVPIVYGVGFYIINFGERFYRDKKGYILFLVLIILVSGLIIGSLFLPEDYAGFVFIPDPLNTTGYDEYFEISDPLAIFLFAVITIFTLVDLVFLIRIFPDTENKFQKRRISSLMVVVISYFLGLVNLIVIDMQFFIPATGPGELPTPIWDYIFITSALFLFSIFLLYISIIRKKKVES